VIPSTPLGGGADLTDIAERQSFERQVAAFGEALADRGEGAASFTENAARGAKRGELDAARRLCIALARVAFVTPGAITPIYDAFVRGWLEADEGSPIDVPALASLREETELPARFWASFWGIVSDAGKSISAGEITARVAALAGDLPSSFGERAEAAARAHPGAADAAARAVPAPLSLATLAEQPEGSLGNAFHHLIVDNNFDLEVLDRQAIGLQYLPPALRYLNTRILQMHDIWHLVGGYATTALHEIAISSFQLAQFGHNYSAMFLATVATSTRLHFPAGLPVMLQVIAEAWRHGRASPPFMAIEWESEWHRPIAEIRDRHGIAPFASAFSADLIEQARAARAAAAL